MLPANNIGDRCATVDKVHKLLVIAGKGTNILHKKFMMHRNSNCDSIPESTLGISCSGNYGDMCNMADTSQSLATETVRCHGSEVVEGTYFACCKSLANNLHVIPLQRASNTVHS